MPNRYLDPDAGKEKAPNPDFTAWVKTNRLVNPLTLLRLVWRPDIAPGFLLTCINNPGPNLNEAFGEEAVYPRCGYCLCWKSTSALVRQRRPPPHR